MKTLSTQIASYPAWLNLLLYQGIWFSAVLGRTPYAWIPFALVAVHFLLCKSRSRELAIVFACSALGLCVDTALTLFGVFVFDPEPSMLPIPIWLIAIWLGFCATLRHGLSSFMARPVLLIALAILGAPLSYLGAHRLGAVELPLGQWQTGLILAPIWGLIMAALILITRRSSADVLSK